MLRPEGGAPSAIEHRCAPNATVARKAATPLVSVVIPTFDRAELVIEAISSVQRQTFRDFEIIVVDDASRDNTVARIRALDEPRLRLIRHDVNKGAAAARNSAIAAARGRYIAFLDSDDLWTLDKLEKHLDFLRSNDDRFRVSCAGWYYIVPGSTGADDRVPSPLLTFDDFLLGCRCSPGSTMIAEASLFREVGPFDEALSRLEDWEWLLRCARVSSVGVYQHPLAVIDIRAAEQRHYEAVRRSAHVFLRSFKQGEGRKLGRRANKMLRATLWNEVAASAYQSGRYATAVICFIASLWLLPGRDLGFYRRILTRVGRDVAQVADVGDLIVSRAELMESRR